MLFDSSLIALKDLQSHCVTNAAALKVIFSQEKSRHLVKKINGKENPLHI